MQHRPIRSEEPPHDVLAAEEFGVPAPDPRLHDEPPHDVLVAEEYALPAPDPVLHHHGPVALPDDPGGRPVPRDVLAAEEYAMPTPPQGRSVIGSPGAGPVRRGRRGVPAGVALGIALTMRARRRRRAAGRA
jgi:hypothetical protein